MQTSMGISAAVALQQQISDCASFHDDDTWADQETAGCVFKDARLGCRFGKLLKRMGCAMGESIPLVCQDWANTKAAYRFLANERVSEADILGGHFHSTCGRFAATGGPVLKGRKPIDWKLITDLQVRSNKDAIEKLNWYATGRPR